MPSGDAERRCRAAMPSGRRDRAGFDSAAREIAIVEQRAASGASADPAWC